MESMSTVKRTLEDAGDVIDKLQFEKEFYLSEMETLDATIHALQTEVRDLNDAVDSLMTENEELAKDARTARKSFTCLQIAVSMLVFVYGIAYGAYLSK
jgi:chromosome segregation ATPase